MPNRPSEPITPSGLVALALLCVTALAALWIIFR